MGWTGLHRRKGLSDKEFFEQEYNSIKILDTARHGQTAFLKAQHVETGETFAIVILFRISRGRYNFYYKDISEDMGPYEVQCPLRIIEGLSEPINKYAKQWRERVREWNANRSPKAKIGDLIKFATPIEFTNGEKLDTFRLANRYNGSRQIVFVAPLGSDYRYDAYTIKDWRDRKYTVVS